MAISNLATSLSDVFNGRLFRIPDYQRGYAWGEKQLVDFWEDLNNIHKMPHYTGVLTLKEINCDETNKDYWLVSSAKSYKMFQVVDGQQRLTTVVILISAFVNFFKNNNKNLSDENIYIGEESLKEIKEKYLFLVSKDKLKTSCILDYDDNIDSSSFLKENIIQVDGIAKTLQQSNFYTENIKRAADFFYRNLEKKCTEEKIDYIKTLYVKLVRNITFFLFEIDDSYDVGVAFETMNNRGKPLSTLELLKNRLIYLLSLFVSMEKNSMENLRNAINKCWAQIYINLGRNPSLMLSDDAYLKDHWICYFNYSRSKANAYKDFLLKRFSSQNVFSYNTEITSYSRISKADDDVEEENIDNSNISDEDDKQENSKLTPQIIQSYITSLQNLSMYWSLSYSPSHELFPSSDLTKEEILWIDKLNHIGIRYFRPLVTVVLSKKVTASKRIELFKTIERFIFIVFCLGGASSSFGNSHFYKKSKQLNESPDAELCNNIENIINLLNEHIKNRLKLSIENFLNQTNYRFDKFDGYFSWGAIKYFLYEYELHLEQMNANENKIMQWSNFNTPPKDKISIEHILPQTHTCPSWKEEFNSIPDKSMKYYVGALGNLLPLKESINSSLQNYSFEEKKNGIKSDGTPLRRGYSHGCHSEIDVSKEPNWGPKQIKVRSIKLIEFMNERWGLGLSDDQKKQLIDFNDESQLLSVNE